MNLGELAEKIKVLLEDNKIPPTAEVEMESVGSNGYEKQLIGVDTIQRYGKLIVNLQIKSYY